MSTETTATVTNTAPALLTVAEAAAELRISTSTLYREIEDGNIVYHLVRKKRLIHREDLDAYLARSRTVSQGTPQVMTYTQTRRKLSAAAMELIGDDDFEVKPRAKKGAKQA